MNKTKLMKGNNIELLKKLPDNSIDSIVSDPPYGLSFMGKKWDYDVPSVDFWKEVYRVLKPGGHILSFGGTRTYHRMAVNIEDAGFEIRDQIMWLYGSGFPKSHNIGLNIDKKNGEIGNRGKAFVVAGQSGQKDKDTGGDLPNPTRLEGYKSKNEWNGWGSALKPAVEPICLARKPLSEKSIAENVLKWRTGGINVDGCRVGTDIIETNMKNTKGGLYNLGNEDRTNEVANTFNEGRFPANIILECICDEVIKGEKGEVKKSNGRVRENHNYNSVGNMGSYDGQGTIDNYNDKGDIHTNPMCPCRLMDEQSGVSKPSKGRTGIKGGGTIHEGGWKKDVEGHWPADNGGGASRFFYQAKVSKKERNMGLDGFEIKINIGTIKLLIYKRKNEILWERQDLNQTHQVDMEQLHQKDIEEYTTKEECVWNTELFGNYIMEKFQKDIKSIIKMKTNSITIYQTLNSLIQQSTNEYIATQQKELMDGIKFVESADKKSTKAIITYQKKDGLNQNVNLVSSQEVWNISVEEEIKSIHPTMKPVSLMAYLCRLITPPNGIILDPFMGSGSTGIAALLEGFRFVGMEMDEDYFKIAEARIENYESYREFLKNK